MTEALFKYQVRVSPKGRNVRLRVTLKDGLVVVVPRGYDEKNVPSLLERKKHWIREALDRSESHRKFFEPEPTWRLPLQINLPAVSSVWHVTARETDTERVIIRELHDHRLLIFGAIEDQKACRAALGRWLIRKTKEHLMPRLQTVGHKTGLRYNRAFVKRQRTRWASCSRHNTVALNAKLLFLPPDIVDYVMIHELCHVKEMNHSNRFWQLVERHCPQYKKHDSKLRDMWKAVPRWAS